MLVSIIPTALHEISLLKFIAFVFKCLLFEKSLYNLGFPKYHHINLPSLFKIFKKTKVGGEEVKNKFILLSRVCRLWVLGKA